MKNLIKRTSGALAMALFAVNNAFAQSGQSLWTRGGGEGTIASTRGGDLASNVTTVINWFLGMLGLVAVAFLIYAGVLMVTAGGNEEQVNKAKKVITYAVIGIVIVILSYTIVSFVTSIS